MKLPSINYKQREALAKVNPMDYLRIGNAKAQGLKTVGKLVGDAGEAYYKQESVTQMQTGLLTYNKTLDDIQQNLKPYAMNEGKGKPEGTWINGQSEFKKQEREIRQVALEQATTPLAKKLINEAADKNLNQRLRVNVSQLLNFKNEHDVAALQTTIDAFVDKNNYEGAAEAVARNVAVGILGDAKGQKVIKDLMRQSIEYDFSVEAKSVSSPAELIRFEEKVNGSTLDVRNKEQNISLAQSLIIDDNREAMHRVIQEAEKQEGGTPAKAEAAGRRRLDKLMRTDSKLLGGNESFKQQTYIANKIILDQYHVKVKKASVESKRNLNRINLIEGKDVAGMGYNETAYSDGLFKDKYGWKLDGASNYTKDYDNPNPDLRSVSPEDILTNRLGAADVAVAYSAEGGHMPVELEKIIEAGFIDSDGNKSSGSAAIAWKLGEENSFALFATGKTSNSSIVYTQMKLSGKGLEGKDKAIATMRAYNKIDEGQRAALIGSSTENTKYLNDSFDEIVKKVNPSGTWYESWLGSSLETKSYYKNLVRQDMDVQLVINGGDKRKSVEASIIAMSGDWGVSTINGKRELMQEPPEKVKPNDPSINNDEGWRRTQGLAEVKAAFPDRNIDEGTIKFYKSSKFDRKDPSYIIEGVEFGMVVDLGVYTPDETLTPKYIEQKEQKIKDKQALKDLEKMNRNRILWNEKYSKDMTPLEKFLNPNPWGEDPSNQSALGKGMSTLRGRAQKYKKKQAAESAAFWDKKRGKRFVKAQGRK